MHTESKSVLLVSMPFAGIDIPSIQLGVLESYLRERDVDIQTVHLYLNAAEIYGLRNYAQLIYPPNDSYTAQMIFSKYLFPEHYEKNQEKLKEYFSKTHQGFTFEEYSNKTDLFYNWFFENINWQDFDIIGFTLNYGQFLPSLAVTKKIKEINSDKIVVLGGSRTTGVLGKRVLETFPFVDYIVSGDGEEALYRLSTRYEKQNKIPGLIYRKNGEILWNQTGNTLDMNNLPTPSFESFYDQITKVSPEIQQFYNYNGKLPVEISRGCWWNKCTFCNLNLQHNRYREKSVEKIVEEINFLSVKYKTLNFQIIGNTLPAKDYRALCEEIIELDKDFTFFAEARADHLNSEDYRLLKNAGFTNIQTGIESFSQNYLKKMNKGARVIDNIAALKFCKQNNIKNSYNLIFGYPNEEEIDFEETKNTVQLFMQYLDPPQLCHLRVVHGSKIHFEPESFNIERLEHTTVDKIMFPDEILKKSFNFVFDYKSTSPVDEDRWEKLVNIWKEERQKRQINSVNTQSVTDEQILYFVDGGSFLKIYDKRNPNGICIYNLDGLEREIFLQCIDVTSFTKLKEMFSDTSESELIEVLKTFEEAGIVFKESDEYLALPIKTHEKDVTIKYAEENQNIFTLLSS